MVPCSNGQTGPSQVFPRGLEQACSGGLATLCNLSQYIGTQQVHHGKDYICREWMGRRVREERKQRQEEGRLVVDTTIVRRDVVGIEEKTFLHYMLCQIWLKVRI